jgi:hypothetical protein
MSEEAPSPNVTALDNLLVESIERVRQKIVRFRGVVSETTAARREQKRSCRLEKDKELEALVRIAVGDMPVPSI